MQWLRKFAIGLAAIVLATSAWANNDVEKNVVYGMYSGLALLMDVHRAESPNGVGLLVVPGSGWEAPMGYGAHQLKESYEINSIFGLNLLLDAGYTLFVINHRATPRFQFPAPIDDVQRAVRFIRHHASNYGIDAARMGALGGSSGGHLVSLLATMDGKGNNKDADPVNRESASVQSVAAIYPAIDLMAFETTNPWAGGAITALLGPVNPSWKPPNLIDPDAVALYRRASPITHISPGDPPVLLVHGDADSVVPYTQSELFYTALKEADIPVRLIKVPGGDHGPGLLVEDRPDYVQAIVSWFDHYLRPK